MGVRAVRFDRAAFQLDEWRAICFGNGFPAGWIALVVGAGLFRQYAPNFALLSWLLPALPVRLRIPHYPLQHWQRLYARPARCCEENMYRRLNLVDCRGCRSFHQGFLLALPDRGAVS